MGGEAGQALHVAEKTVFGMDHAEAGMWLAAKWNLGADLTQAICWHHNPELADETCWDLAALVHAGNYICKLRHH